VKHQAVKRMRNDLYHFLHYYYFAQNGEFDILDLVELPGQNQKECKPLQVHRSQQFKTSLNQKTEMCDKFEAAAIGTKCVNCQKDKSKHSEEAINPPKPVEVVPEKPHYEGCDKYDPPALGTKCKSCQKDISKHSDEAVHGPKKIETKIHYEGCDKYVAPDLGTKCKTCQKDIKKHAPGTRPVLEGEVAPPPEEHYEGCDTYVKPQLGTKCVTCQKDSKKHSPAARGETVHQEKVIPADETMEQRAVRLREEALKRKAAKETATHQKEEEDKAKADAEAAEQAKRAAFKASHAHQAHVNS